MEYWSCFCFDLDSNISLLHVGTCPYFAFLHSHKNVLFPRLGQRRNRLQKQYLHSSNPQQKRLFLFPVDHESLLNHLQEKVLSCDMPCFRKSQAALFVCNRSNANFFFLNSRGCSRTLGVSQPSFSADCVLVNWMELDNWRNKILTRLRSTNSQRITFVKNHETDHFYETWPLAPRNNSFYTSI